MVTRCTVNPCPAANPVTMPSLADAVAEIVEAGPARGATGGLAEGLAAGGGAGAGFVGPGFVGRGRGAGEVGDEDGTVCTGGGGAAVTLGEGAEVGVPAPTRWLLAPATPTGWVGRVATATPAPAARRARTATTATRVGRRWERRADITTSIPDEGTSPSPGQPACGRTSWREQTPKGTVTGRVLFPPSPR